jgi:hypothetical protein
MLNGFQKGLAEAGFTEGQTVTVDYRFADGHYERLAPLAAELAGSPIAVLSRPVASRRRGRQSRHPQRCRSSPSSAPTPSVTAWSTA